MDVSRQSLAEPPVVPVAAIVEFLGERVVSVFPASQVSVVGPAAVLPGKPKCFSFASVGRNPGDLDNSLSSLLLITPAIMREMTPRPDQALIAVADPRREFARIVTHFFTKAAGGAVSPSAVIEASALIGRGTSVGPGAYIAAGVVVGERCAIGANCVLLEGTQIGDDTSIGPNTTIGHVGFGYAREPDGSPVLIPHMGGVRIGSSVDIGANTCIDRGTLEDTVIEDHVKIDNLVHIAHNCHIQGGAFIIATAILCGGVTVGQRSWVSPNATVKQQLTLGDDVIVGLGATVLKDVPSGATVVGSPAKELPK